MNKLTLENFTHFQKEVERFNEMMGNKVFKAEDEQLALRETYRLLSLEELTSENELLDSIDKGDGVGTLDGYIDCIFTVFYYTRLQGFDLTDDLHWLKQECDKATGGVEDLQKHLNCMRESLEKDEDSFSAQTDLIIVLISEQDKFDFVGAFEETMRSNMSKYAVKEDIDIVKELEYITSVGRYGELSYDEIAVDEKVYIAFKSMIDLHSGVKYNKPKLIKCSTFSEPELEQFIIKSIKGDK